MGGFLIKKIWDGIKKPWNINKGFMSSTKEWHSVVSGFMVGFILLISFKRFNVFAGLVTLSGVYLLSCYKEFTGEEHYIIFGFFISYLIIYLTTLI